MTNSKVTDSSSTPQNPKPTVNSQDGKMSLKDLRPKYRESTFLKLYLALQICGMMMIGLAIIWIVKYNGGFSWSDIDLRFNFHPILMVLGMIYFSGNSLLAFRVLKDQPKPLVKIVHSALHITAFTTALIGSIAVFTNHFETDKP